jgi:hypothetical protein
VSATGFSFTELPPPAAFAELLAPSAAPSSSTSLTDLL